MAPSSHQTDIASNHEATPIKYVVVRNGHRVSDKDYDAPNNPRCLDEINFWTRVSNNTSFGEKVEVVPYDSKRHRVW